MAVIDLRSQSSPLDRYLEQWMAKSAAEDRMRQQQEFEAEQEQKRLAQQQSQFDASLGLDRQRTDAQVGLYGAQTDGAKYAVASDRANKIAASIKGEYDKLVAAGLLEQATAYAKGATAHYANDPEVQAAVIGMVTPRPETSLDVTARNTAQIGLNATNAKLSGKPTAVDESYAYKLTTGEAIPSHTYGGAREDQYGIGRPAANVKTGLAVSADQKYASDTSAAAGIRQQEIATAGQSAGAQMRGAGQAGDGAYQNERAGRITSSVDSLLGRVNGWTTGYGSVLANIPETDARDFRADLDTLKANIAFGELQAMRDASKTGGALGQVAIREIELLESSLGALDQGQSPENLKDNLQKIKGSLTRWGAAQAGGAAGGGGYRMTATNPQTGQRIGSNDGVNWEPIQ